MNIGQRPIKSPLDSHIPNYNSVGTPKEFIAIPIATQCKCNQIDKSNIANIRQEQSRVCLCIIWTTITGFTLIIILNIIARINTKK